MRIFLLFLSFLTFSSLANAQTAGCLTAPNGQYPSGVFTPNCTGTTELIVDYAFTGEYSVVKLTAGVTYEFIADPIEGDVVFVTVATADGTTVLSSGAGKATWTATADGNVRFYTHRNASCLSSDWEFTARRIKCTQIIRDFYCEPSLNCSDGAVIQSVKLADLESLSGCSSSGFSDFSAKTATVSRGGTYTLEVIIGYGWFEQSVSVWIDYNKNFLFDANEFIYVGSTDQGTLTKTITMPANIADGDYRMRVRLSTVGPAGATAGKACDVSDTYGETEDYTLKVQGTMGVGHSSVQAVQIYPNPAKDVVNISAPAAVSQIMLTDGTGRQVAGFGGTEKINVSHLKAGMYLMTIRLKDGTVITKKLIKQ